MFPLVFDVEVLYCILFVGHQGVGVTHEVYIDTVDYLVYITICSQTMTHKEERIA